MGFRSTFITDDTDVAWPDWFRKKYEGWIRFPEKSHGPLSSTEECKVYGAWENLHKDIQKAIDWKNRPLTKRFIVVFLHECGGITRCQIEKHRILWSQPISYRETNGSAHEQCWGCSDIE